MGKIRGTNSTPGFYSSVEDFAVSTGSLGITTLGIVGETLKGPAFEPVFIKDWAQYQEYFGGISAETYKDSKYARYQLPYVAKSYLTKSDQLYVCRVLGLSGYNAGPAFVISAYKSDDTTKHVVAVLRSRGHYQKYANVGDTCNPINKYDTIVYDCKSIELLAYKTLSTELNCGSLTGATLSGDTEIKISPINYGQFTIKATLSDGTVKEYPVSLNYGSKDYIYNVLGDNPMEGTAPLFVEELYDLDLQRLIEEEGCDRLEGDLKIEGNYKIALTEPVDNVMSVPMRQLGRNQLGKTYLCTEANPDYKYYKTEDRNYTITGDSATEKDCEAGAVYVVKEMRLPGENTKKYIYTEYRAKKGVEAFLKSGETPTIILKEGDVVNLTKGEGGKVFTTTTTSGTSQLSTSVGGGVGELEGYVTVMSKANNRFYIAMKSGATTTVISEESKDFGTHNMDDYHESYRWATTPWIVSELKSSGGNVEVKRLFRFHTITDGNTANSEVKISIANILPDEGKFDVYVRDFSDSDTQPQILESYRGVTMVPGTKNYLGLKIGTYDGAYELRSKYVMVEIIENDMTAQCVPAGFLGYPTREYPEGYEKPSFVFNTFIDDSIKSYKKQYFGLSDITGVDIDMLSYKGKSAYHSDMNYGYTEAFHLDATLSQKIKELLESENSIKVTLDGVECDFNWQTVSPELVKDGETQYPIIASEYEMEDSIYSDVKLRKFTVYPCGGFDGWDIYRGVRTTGDEFKADKYKGSIGNGAGATFSSVMNTDALNLEGRCITSDYYAFLAGAKQFENKEMFRINLFATPGIDYVNDGLLSSEILEMVEERNDMLYVMTTPDKPFGMSDDITEMYTGSDVAGNLIDSNIDSWHACTYYPWVKYWDKVNSKYVMLPATKDVLRNMADVDNKKYPWFAPAGLERGNVECVNIHKFTKLEDSNAAYDAGINSIVKFSKDGIKVWGNKTMYTADTPLNRINSVRLFFYVKRLIEETTRILIFDPNDTTLKTQFESIVKPILNQVKADRGITDYVLKVSQTPEEMDAHELSAVLGIKPTPTLEYIEMAFKITPQGVDFDTIL